MWPLACRLSFNCSHFPTLHASDFSCAHHQIHRELYFAILMDRAYGGPVLVASTQGGMDIEEVRVAMVAVRGHGRYALGSPARPNLNRAVLRRLQVAEKHPEAIVKEPVDITVGLTRAAAARLAAKLGLTGPLAETAIAQFYALYKLFIETDATQVEFNPLAEGSVPGASGGTRIFCGDAKLNFDDNAAFRHGDIYAHRDKSMENWRDVAAEEAGLNYIGLDGSIGCLVNGAGLAMATMDIIKLHGGAPANFLDVGGGATAAQVTAAFKILTSDPAVRAILVNIFGGIMKCDTIAAGIITAAKDVGLTVPLVVRLEGTNVELGKRMLRESGIALVTADDLDDAAQKAIATVVVKHH